MILHTIAGFMGLIVLAWAMSEDRRGIPWRTVAAGVALQWVIGALLLKLPVFKDLFLLLNNLLLALEKATQAGTAFVFGYLGGGGEAPFIEKTAGLSFVLAFRALPLVLVVSALSALLFYWRILPLLVRTLSFLLEQALGIGGAVGLSAAANIFVGMVEAPLIIRPYLREVSRGELFMIMTGGMASIAGTVLVVYASILGSVIPEAMGHLLIASVMSAPAAITVSALMVPPQGRPTSGRLDFAEQATSSIDAI